MVVNAYQNNYKPFNSRTLVEIARDKCLASGVFIRNLISSNYIIFEELVICKEVEFLLRNKNLSDNDPTTDMVVDFFFEEFSSCESILWVNSVNPLQSIKDIKKLWSSFISSDLDCVMAVNNLYQHYCIANKPLNFKPSNSFEKTQDLKIVQRYIYSCMSWKRETYVKYGSEGFKRLFSRNIGLV